MVFPVNWPNVQIRNYWDNRGFSWGQSLLTVPSWLDVLVIILGCQVNSPIYGAFQLVSINGEPSLFNERVGTSGPEPTTLY